MSDHKTVAPNTAIGRYGVAYVSKVCAHAHIGFKETGNDQDVLAIDGTFEYHVLGVRVQIKATTQWSLTVPTGTLQFPISDTWRDKWRANKSPAYLIVVLLDPDVANWVTFADSHTLSAAYALWARIDNLAPSATHVELDRERRFTTETVGEWGDALLDHFGMREEPA